MKKARYYNFSIMINVLALFIALLNGVAGYAGIPKIETPIDSTLYKKDSISITIQILDPPKNLGFSFYEPINNDVNSFYCPPVNQIKLNQDTIFTITRPINEANTYVIQYGICRAILNLLP
jgi:hypothetical protein